MSSPMRIGAVLAAVLVSWFGATVIPAARAAEGQGGHLPNGRWFHPRTYVISFVVESQPGRVTYPKADFDVVPKHPIYGGLSRSTGTDWAGPHVGRESDHWLVAPPPHTFSYANPTFESFALPFAWAHVGRNAWFLDSAHRRILKAHASEDIGPPGMALSTFERFNGAKTLPAILDVFKGDASECRSSRYLGRSSVAARSVYVVEFSRQGCFEQFPPVPSDGGRFVVWIDTQTSYVLRLDQYDYGDRHQLLRRVFVTSVRYNVPLNPALFRLTIPTGYRLCKVVDAATIRCPAEPPRRR